MDLEAREKAGPDKTKYSNRVKTYEKEVQKLEQELVCLNYDGRSRLSLLYRESQQWCSQPDNLL